MPAASGDRPEVRHPGHTRGVGVSRNAVAVRPAQPDDAAAVAGIWRSGWRDGHLGFVSDELVAVRTDASFGVRAAERIDDTTVATVGDAVVAGNARARVFYERMGWRDDGPFEYAAEGPDGPIAVPCHRYARSL